MKGKQPGERSGVCFVCSCCFCGPYFIGTLIEVFRKKASIKRFLLMPWNAVIHLHAELEHSMMSAANMMEIYGKTTVSMIDINLLN